MIEPIWTKLAIFCTQMLIFAGPAHIVHSAKRNEVTHSLLNDVYVSMIIMPGDSWKYKGYSATMQSLLFHVLFH